MNRNENYFAYQITVDSAASEAIEFGLNELDALGTEINNLGQKPTETLTVVGYFGEPQQEENLRNQLTEALRIYGFALDVIREISPRHIGNIDWLFEWKKHWKATVTDKFIIAPSWENVEDSDKIVVRIEPNMAFGTGTHETTKLCLKAIGENYRKGMSFLDVGTGTGILAIAAAKMNSEFKIRDLGFSGCDTDANSITIAEENAALNEVEGIDFFIGSIAEGTLVFDFVCANILLEVIVLILPRLLEKSGKILVLSGILKEQKTLLTDELNRLQITAVKIETDGEWLSAVIFRDAE